MGFQMINFKNLSEFFRQMIYWLKNPFIRIQLYKHFKMIIIQKHNLLSNKIHQFEKKIIRLGSSKIAFNFLFQVHRQLLATFTLILFLFFYLWHKIKKQQREIQNKHQKVLKSLEEISEKSIKHKKKNKIFEAEEQNDSCCEQINNTLNEKKHLKQDQLFFQIFRSYNNMETQKNHNQALVLKQSDEQIFDTSSTHQGNKRNIHRNKKSNQISHRKQQQLNKSSVL